MWAAYARNITPLPGRALPPLDVVDDPPLAPSQPRADALERYVPARRTVLSPIRVGDHPGGLDNGSWNRLRSGKIAPMRTLDLHGRTVQRAFHALQAFLIAAHADHVRCVEIITGRGSGETGGAIRREMPIWLNLPGLRPLVLAASYPHAANTGAVRLLLRRPR